MFVRITLTDIQDIHETFKFDVDLDEKLHVTGKWFLFGVREYMDGGPKFEPCVIRADGDVTFGTVDETIWSTNLRDREIQNGENIAFWGEAGRRGKEWTFRVTSITVLGKRQFEFPKAFHVECCEQAERRK